MKPDISTTVEPTRLARADRREALLDAALSLVLDGDADGVTIESVADRAGVSRPLVYKHFANRTEILTALYRREGDLLHEALSAEVRAADTLEDMYRALVRGSLRAARERGETFEALRAVAGLNEELRELQRSRDRQTVAFYTELAVRDFGMDADEAEAMTAMVLGAIAPALLLWHRRPTTAYADLLEQVYMQVLAGALDRLAPRHRERQRRLGIVRR